MASSWKNSWGKSWGNSWGIIIEELVEIDLTQPRRGAGQSSEKPVYLTRNREQEIAKQVFTEEEEIQLLVKVMSEICL